MRIILTIKIIRIFLFIKQQKHFAMCPDLSWFLKSLKYKTLSNYGKN